MLCNLGAQKKHLQCDVHPNQASLAKANNFSESLANDNKQNYFACKSAAFRVLSSFFDLLLSQAQCAAKVKPCEGPGENGKHFPEKPTAPATSPFCLRIEYNTFKTRTFLIGLPLCTLAEAQMVCQPPEVHAENEYSQYDRTGTEKLLRAQLLLEQHCDHQSPKDGVDAILHSGDKSP